MHTTEVEVRFLEIDKQALVAKLLSLGAQDLGEQMLEEVIIYDKDMKWQSMSMHRFVRIRKKGDDVRLTYKEHTDKEKGEAQEVELKINDLESGIRLMEALGFVAYRRQQKKRHTLVLKEVIFDIDTWPRIPTYVELEGPSLNALQKAASAVGFDWKKAVYEDARTVIENVYHIPVGKMRWFTFSKFE